MTLYFIITLLLSAAISNISFADEIDTQPSTIVDDSDKNNDAQHRIYNIYTGHNIVGEGTMVNFLVNGRLQVAANYPSVTPSATSPSIFFHNIPNDTTGIYAPNGVENQVNITTNGVDKVQIGNSNITLITTTPSTGSINITAGTGGIAEQSTGFINLVNTVSVASSSGISIIGKSSGNTFKSVFIQGNSTGGNSTSGIGISGTAATGLGGRGDGISFSGIGGNASGNGISIFGNASGAGTGIFITGTGVGTVDNTGTNADVTIFSNTNGIVLSTESGIPNSIKLVTNGGATETINITNTLGTNATAIGLTATAGGITLTPATGGTVTIAGALAVTGATSGYITAVKYNLAPSAISNSLTVTDDNTVAESGDAPIITYGYGKSVVLIAPTADAVFTFKLPASPTTGQTMTIAVSNANGTVINVRTSNNSGTGINPNQITLAGGTNPLIGFHNSVTYLCISTTEIDIITNESDGIWVAI